MTNKNSSVYKVIILGDSDVGKTSLMHQFVNHRFESNYSATVGTDFFTKNLRINGKEVILQIWDTAGQERFQSLGNSFYRGAHCCMLVYDVTRPETLCSLKQWKEDFLEAAQPEDPCSFPFLIIGNKTDLLEHGIGGVKYRKKWDDKPQHIISFQTSAKDASNVEYVFRTVAEEVVLRDIENEYEKIQLSEAIILQIEESFCKYKKNQKCC